MEEEQNQENLSRRERRKILREQEKIGEERSRVTKKLGYWVIGLVVIGLLIGGAWWFLRQPGISEEEIVSRKGLHWHPELMIYIRGEKQEIPANVGIGVAHEPIHTHDANGTLHMEMIGLITKDQTKLDRFFKIWGKQLNQNCIFEFCNNEGGKVKMMVNGQENTEFENYHMRDKDKIEIRYE